MRINKPYTNKEYADLAVYCNENNCHIEDNGDYLESVQNVLPEPTDEEQKQARILELKQFLTSTDYVSCKLIEAIDETELQDLKEKYKDVLKQRREARAEINKLEA